MVGIARWLGHIKSPGRATPALAMAVDFLPTFVRKPFDWSHRQQWGVNVALFMSFQLHRWHIIQVHTRFQDNSHLFLQASYLSIRDA